MQSAIRNDRAELDALLAGDSDRWRAWMAFAYRVARGQRFQMSRQEADDVVQETFKRLWQRLPDVRDPVALPAYVMQIVRNEVRQRWRREVLKPDVIPVDPPPGTDGPSPADTISSDTLDPEREALRREALEIVRRWIQDTQRTARNRQIAQLHFLDGWKTGEIAVQVGVEEGIVSNVLSRCRRVLRSAGVGLALPSGQRPSNGASAAPVEE